MVLGRAIGSARTSRVRYGGIAAEGGDAHDRGDDVHALSLIESSMPASLSLRTDAIQKPPPSRWHRRPAERLGVVGRPTAFAPPERRRRRLTLQLLEAATDRHGAAAYYAACGGTAVRGDGGDGEWRRAWTGSTPRGTWRPSHSCSTIEENASWASTWGRACGAVPVRRKTGDRLTRQPSRRRLKHRNRLP